MARLGRPPKNKKLKNSKKAESTPEVAQTLTIREEIIDVFEKRHIQYMNKDGHFGIKSSQFMDTSTIEDLIGVGMQAMNVRADTTGPYIAIYY